MATPNKPAERDFEAASQLRSLLRNLEMREKRQRQTLNDTVAQLDVLRRQLELL
jgi:hypothetical protein